MSERKPWWETVPKAPVDYVIEERRVLVEGRKKPVTGIKALVVDDNVLGIVGGRYKVVQPKELVSWAKEIRKYCTGSAPTLRTWSMREGKVLGASFVHSTWTLPTPGSYPKPPVLSAVVHATSLNGGGGREIYLDVEHDGLVYPVTLGLYVSPNETMGETIKSIETRLQTFIGLSEVFTEMPVTLTNFSTLIAKVWPKPGESAGQKSQTRWKTRKDEIVTIWQENDSTAWGALTAINEWAQYERAFRGSGGDRAANDRMRGEETLLGRARTVGLTAYDALRTRSLS